MQWQLKHGANLDWYQELADEDGFVADALLSRPELDIDLIPYWDAFQKLNGSRPIGFGAFGAIALSEIKAYLDLYDITDPGDREDYIHMIMALDSEFLRLKNADRSKHQHRQQGSEAGGQRGQD